MNVVFTNKNVTCQYRAVGHPIAVALTEGIVDLAAQKLGMDPAEFRRRNLIADDAYPYTFPSGIKFEKLSHHKTLGSASADDATTTSCGPSRRSCASKDVYRGIGLAAMIEVTNPSPAFYGVGGARISAQDGATLRLEPTGMVTVLCSVTEQGQGTEAIFAQIAASAVGVSLDKVKVITGDTGVTPYGGGTWASRGAGIGGEAVLQAGPRAALEHPRRRRRDPEDGQGRAGHRRQRGGQPADAEKPSCRWPSSAASRTSARTRCRWISSPSSPSRATTRRAQYGFTFTNGIQASLVEVDPDTGFVKLLKHWCVEDSRHA